MSRSGRWLAVLAAIELVAATASGGPSKGPVPLRTPEQALKALLGSEEEAGRAEEYLLARQDLLPRQEKGLSALLDARPGDPDLARRILRVMKNQGDAGCAFVARRLDPRRPALVRQVFSGEEVTFSCPDFDLAIVRVLGQLRNLHGDPEWAPIIHRVLQEVRSRAIGLPTQTSCFLVLQAAGEIRDLALETALAKPSAGLSPCLVQAWEELARRDRDPEFRARLIQGLAGMERTEAVPALTRALEKPEDRGLACRLLQQMGNAGREGLAFALRTGDGRAAGLQQCIREIGPVLTGELLGLLDHPAPRVREFVLEFLTTHQTPEGRQSLVTRFLQGAGAIPRPTLLRSLAAFGAEAIEEPLRAALSDDSPAIRRVALGVVEEVRATNLGDLIRELAEEDPEPSLRVRALEVAWHLGDESILPLARRQAAYEEAVVAAKALQVMGFLGGEADLSAVAGAMQHQDPTIAEAAVRAAWLLGLESPRKGKVRFASVPRPPKAPKVQEVSCEGVTARVAGRKGPVVLLLPGGPGMDLSWAEPWLWDLATDARLALISLEGDGTEARAGLVSLEQVRCLAQALGARRVMVVSAGLGGTWAQVLAARDPETIGAVGAIASPLPGRLEDLDPLLREGLEEPLRPWVADLVENQQRFLPEVLNRCFARAFARTLAGPRGDPREGLRVQWDLLRQGAAMGVLARVPAEEVVPGPSTRFLFLLPGGGLPEALRDAYLSAVASEPGRGSLASWEGCGFLPEIACGSKVVKALGELARSAVLEEAR